MKRNFFALVDRLLRRVLRFAATAIAAAAVMSRSDVPVFAQYSPDPKAGPRGEPESTDDGEASPADVVCTISTFPPDR